MYLLHLFFPFQVANIAKFYICQIFSYFYVRFILLWSIHGVTSFHLLLQFKISLTFIYNLEYQINLFEQIQIYSGLNSLITCKINSS